MRMNYRQIFDFSAVYTDEDKLKSLPLRKFENKDELEANGLPQIVDSQFNYKKREVCNESAFENTCQATKKKVADDLFERIKFIDISNQVEEFSKQLTNSNAKVQQSIKCISPQIQIQTNQIQGQILQNLTKMQVYNKNNKNQLQKIGKGKFKDRSLKYLINLMDND
ncbi:Hypothetical_protein [Hexamita inflata]|uniref:Hypothetical_protein n=1 Tax=Hexamita inflata TaxID=28002 RepID=A0AA86TQQ8_9EUKA|nr:Hypothetical protein HINF_LOCUS10847 [Hexamita inflata]